jgi:hypothetical protein
VCVREIWSVGDSTQVFDKIQGPEVIKYGLKQLLAYSRIKVGPPISLHVLIPQTPNCSAHKLVTVTIGHTVRRQLNVVAARHPSRWSGRLSRRLGLVISIARPSAQSTKRSKGAKESGMGGKLDVKVSVLLQCVR